VSLSFFFYCPGPHRDPLSFPTRRSSDLSSDTSQTSSSSDRISCPRPVRVGSPLVRGTMSVVPRSPHGVGAGSDRFASCSRATPRSEEHTSELQSLTNLVCRLLLEKKKTP